MTKKHTALKQKIRIHEILKDHLEKNHDDTWFYKDGVSTDESIAHSIDKSLQFWHVKHVRQEMFGPLTRGSSHMRKMSPDFSANVKGILGSLAELIDQTISLDRHQQTALDTLLERIEEL